MLALIPIKMFSFHCLVMTQLSTKLLESSKLKILLMWFAIIRSSTLSANIMTVNWSQSTLIINNSAGSRLMEITHVTSRSIERESCSLLLIIRVRHLLSMNWRTTFLPGIKFIITKEIVCIQRDNRNLTPIAVFFHGTIKTVLLQI